MLAPSGVLFLGALFGLACFRLMCRCYEEVDTRIAQYLVLIEIGRSNPKEMFTSRIL